MCQPKERLALSAVVVGRETSVFDDICPLFQQQGLQVRWAGTGTGALDLLETGPADLMIIEAHLPDMTAKELIEKVVMINAAVHCAVIGSLSEKRFHDRYEGLGVLMQLPAAPAATDITALLKHFERISPKKVRLL
jgi:DNA-binding response OmpR family regulator